MSFAWFSFRVESLFEHWVGIWFMNLAWKAKNNGNSEIKRDVQIHFTCAMYTGHTVAASRLREGNVL